MSYRKRQTKAMSEASQRNWLLFRLHGMVASLNELEQHPTLSREVDRALVISANTDLKLLIQAVYARG